MTEIDWPKLKELAVAAMERAYAPYSGYPVGAAAQTADGRFITGCNVENASYGLGTCAENGLVSALAMAGGGRLVAVWCVNGKGETIVPCGRCRQLLYEFGGDELLVNMPSGGPTPMTVVLPQSFGPVTLANYDGAAPLDIGETIFRKDGDD